MLYLHLFQLHLHCFQLHIIVFPLVFFLAYHVDTYQLLYFKQGFLQVQTMDLYIFYLLRLFIYLNYQDLEILPLLLLIHCKLRLMTRLLYRYLC